MLLGTRPPLHEAVHTLFDHMDSVELRWHLRSMLCMATRSDQWRRMSAEDAEQFFNSTEILIDSLDWLADAFDSAEKEGGHA